jgi:hypothetical protein
VNPRRLSLGQPNLTQRVVDALDRTRRGVGEREIEVEDDRVDSMDQEPSSIRPGWPSEGPIYHRPASLIATYATESS